ncbi:MAG: hypothetical protein ABIH46_02010 [Chloroflexota bacterium]
MMKQFLPKGLPAEGPHRMVDSLLDGLADSAKSMVGSVIGGAKGVGADLSQALDRPFKEVTGMEGPHHVIDRALNGYADAVQNSINTGAIESLKKVGEGIARALDHPLEQLK